MDEAATIVAACLGVGWEISIGEETEVSAILLHMDLEFDNLDDHGVEIDSTLSFILYKNKN